MARRLVDNGPEAHELRDLVHKKIVSQPRKKGGILAALLRSPLVGADLDLERPVTLGRKVDL